MNILISGGTGLVGRELGKVLTQKNHNLFVLTRDTKKSALQCPYPHTPISWDELETHPALKEMDHIVHLAGTNINEKRWNKKFKELIRSSRVNSTQKLVDVANKKCPQLASFISTSAVGIYGNTGELEVVSETHNLSYSFLSKVCQDWEAPLESLEKTRSVIFRLGVVFSEKGGALEKMVPPIQGGIGGALGSGKQFMSWIDIDDLVSLFCFAIENPIQGVFNATAPSPATNQEISEKIAEILGTKLLANIPYFVLRAVVGEIAPHLVESQRISSQKIQNKGFQIKYKDIGSSLQKRVAPLKGLQRRLIFEQWVPRSKEEIFPFFSEAKNLETITPEKLHFKILNVSTEELGEGTLINYKLKIDGVPVRWRTRITAWNPPHTFADNQEKGPYTKWYHLHSFENLGRGTLMTDQVDLQIPLGALGYFASSWKVLRDVQFIFEYRKKVIFEMFH